jgi:hypothetical protein
MASAAEMNFVIVMGINCIISSHLQPRQLLVKLVDSNLHG